MLYDCYFSRSYAADQSRLSKTMWTYANAHILVYQVKIHLAPLMVAIKGEALH